MAIAFLCLPLAAADLPVTGVLDRVGKQVEAFWNNLPAVTCSETLTQEKLGDKGKVLFQQRTSYDYLVLLQLSGGEISVDESRIEKSRRGSKGKVSLLQTNGFSILALIFHPIYQGRYEFTQLPDQVSSGRRLLRIGFRQLPNERSPSVLMLREREYPLQWRGTAWIDPDSYAVLRIQSALEAPMEDVGLLKLEAEVDYSSVTFSGSPAYWLPVRAVVSAATMRQNWRNTHLFSQYRRFEVETHTRSGAAQY
jgi:hypothetical protein